MLKREKEFFQYMLDNEEQVIKSLEKHYRDALSDINMSIRIMQSDELTQSKVYQLQYQQALKKQVEGILERLHAKEYTTIQQYLSESYTNGFVGSMYSMHGQGIPMIATIDQNAAVKAVITDSQIQEGLYDHLAGGIDGMKKAIRAELTRGIASNMRYEDIARNIAFTTKAPLFNAKNIVRTEGHRIQQASADDARHFAASRGADMLKQWDATLDGNTRKTHKDLDGTLVELDELFVLSEKKKARYPGDFGYPEEDCQCRCVCLDRPRWALDESELETLKERAAFFKLDKTKDFEDFKEKYLYAADHPEEYLRKADMPADFKDTRKIGDPIKQDDLKKVIENARLKGVQIGTLDNPTGGFETYCGDVNVLHNIIDQAAKQLESDLFKNARGNSFALLYDNVTGYEGKQKVIDVGAFAMTKGRQITLNKFMFDDSEYLAKEYAAAVAKGLFPNGTDHMCIIAHEAGHIIAKNTGGLYKKVLGIVQKEADNHNMTMDEYIVKNVSIYGKELNSNWDYHELIPELNSMLNSGKKYGIIEVLKKEGVF